MASLRITINLPLNGMKPTPFEIPPYVTRLSLVGDNNNN
jgi:hypothetical protein